MSRLRFCWSLAAILSISSACGETPPAPTETPPAPTETIPTPEETVPTPPKKVVDDTDCEKCEDPPPAANGILSRRTTWVPQDVVSCPSAVPADDALKPLLRRLSGWRLGSPGVAIDEETGAWHIGEEDPLLVGIDLQWYRNFGGRWIVDPTRYSAFHDLQQNLAHLPCYTNNVALRADRAMESSAPLVTFIADAASALDFSITVGGALPVTDEEDPLSHALNQVGAAAGSAHDLAGLPFALRAAIAQTVLVAIEVAIERDAALDSMVAPEHKAHLFQKGPDAWLANPEGGPDPEGDAVGGMYRRTEGGYDRLYSAAARLAQVVDSIRWQRFQNEEVFQYLVPTPLGAIVVRGGGDDVYDPTVDASLDQNLLLVIDTGGDDVYRIPAGANQSADHPVALHIDLAGNDTYEYVEVPHEKDRPTLLPSDAYGRFAGNRYFGNYSLSETGRQGAGHLGFGYLLDLGGGKRHVSLPSQEPGIRELRGWDPLRRRR